MMCRYPTYSIPKYLAKSLRFVCELVLKGVYHNQNLGPADRRKLLRRFADPLFPSVHHGGRLHVCEVQKGARAVAVRGNRHWSKNTEFGPNLSFLRRASRSHCFGKAECHFISRFRVMAVLKPLDPEEIAVFSSPGLRGPWP